MTFKMKGHEFTCTVPLNGPLIIFYLGASTKIRAYDGRDPLLSAVEKRNLEIAEILLKHGANPNSWWDLLINKA